MRPPLPTALLTLAALFAAGRVRAAPGAAQQAQLEAALREAAQASCPGLTVQLDPGLMRAARRYVEAARDGKAAQDGSALSFFASLEAIDPAPTGGVATIGNPSQADRAVGDLLPKTCRYNQAGVAAERTRDGHGVVAVLTAQRRLELAPIPSHVDAGAVVRLAGKLDAGLALPRLYHMGPGGSVEETPLVLRGGSFQLDVTLAPPGEHSLEVLADGSGGPEVIALRRVFAGVDAPDAPPSQAGAPADGNALAEVEQAIAELRHARGLPKLTRDAALDGIALGHSREMARTRTFAHVLKSDGSLRDRLVRASYANHFAGENIGLAENAAEAHKAIVASPAHLMNLLDARHTRLGLGAVAGISPDGETAVYLTEVLAEAIVGSKDPIADVAQVIAAQRKLNKLPPLVRDPRLDSLAQTSVRQLAAGAGHGNLDDPSLDYAKLALERIGSLKTASAERLVVSTPDDAKISKDATGRDWAVFGVGAVYASSKEYGPDRLWVLLLYAR